MIISNSLGNMGLTLEGNKLYPFEVFPNQVCVDIASGADHLVILTQHGRVYTFGCGDQGQLGRMGIRSASGETRHGKTHLLQPELVMIKMGKVEVDAIWTTTYCTFIREKDTNNVYGFGLNNYNQLGVKKISDLSFNPKMTKITEVKQIVGGSHHTIILTKDNKCYAIGRKDYGRLGLGEGLKDVEELTLIPKLNEKNVTKVSCGDATSFALTSEGKVYAWGIGTNFQLGIGNDNDVWEPILLTEKQVRDKQVIQIACGAQHTLFIVTN